MSLDQTLTTFSSNVCQSQLYDILFPKSDIENVTLFLFQPTEYFDNVMEKDKNNKDDNDVMIMIIIIRMKIM